ncbi:MAG: membrane protein insertion efficiency factor YidD [Chlamydiota bacterium]
MRYLLLIAVFSGCSLLSAEEPWGKDASLVNTHNKAKVEQGPLERLGVAVVRFHQKIISPADGPRSHFMPSSSQYTLEAIKKYGFFKGWLLGFDRLMRENNENWIYPHAYLEGKWIKHDPVPSFYTPDVPQF